MLRTETLTPSQRKRSLPFSQTKLAEDLKADGDEGYISDLEEPDWEPSNMSKTNTFMTDDEIDDPFPKKAKKKAKKKLRPAIRPLQSRTNLGETHLSDEETEIFQRRALEQIGLVVPPSSTSQNSAATEASSSSQTTLQGNEIQWVLLKDTTNGSFRRSTTELAISAPESAIDALMVLSLTKEILMETWTGLSEDNIKIAISFSPGNNDFEKRMHQLFLLRSHTRSPAKAYNPRTQGMEAQTLSCFHFSR